MDKLVERDNENKYNYIHTLKYFYYTAIDENRREDTNAVNELLEKYGYSALHY